MNARKIRFIKMTNIIIILLLLAVLTAFITIIYTEYRDMPSETTTYEPEKLTEEEMANRPLLHNSVSNNESGFESGKVEVVLEKPKEYKAYDEIPLDEETQIFMQNICHEYHVGFAFALAILESETDFRFVEGDSGKSIGYFQINKVNWYKYGLDAHYEYDNIEIGVRMLGELIEKYQETDMVIMAYKGGEGFAEEWQQNGKRLDACDKVVDRTMYWQNVIAE